MARSAIRLTLWCDSNVFFFDEAPSSYTFARRWQRLAPNTRTGSFSSYAGFETFRKRLFSIAFWIRLYRMFSSR